MSKLPSAKFNVFIDSDGPVADFDRALQESNADADDFKHWPGVYLWLPITEGAVDSLKILHEFDKQNIIRTWILTKTPSYAPYSYTEKILWYRKNFPWLENRVILTHDKSIVGSEKDFLLDDRPHKANAEAFPGTLIVFDVKKPNDSWTELITKAIRSMQD